MCQAQQQSASLGYSPLPVNLVTESLVQIAKIPGAEVQNINVQQCDNPTFSPSGENLLAANAPQPQACDRQGASQCATGTGGQKAVDTPVAPAAAGGAAAAPGTPAAGSADADAAAGGATGGEASTGGAAPAGSGGGATAGGATAGGATTAASAATTGATPATATDRSAIAPADTTCDPDTGVCGLSAVAQQSTGGGVVASGAQVSGILPTTLDQDSGWGATETLMLVVALFTAGLVFIPAFAWRRMSQASPAPLPAAQPISHDRVSV